MNIIDLIRIKNRVMGAVMPEQIARAAATLFLTPRRFALKDWEHQAEQSCRRIRFSQDMRVACWGDGHKKRCWCMAGKVRQRKCMRLIDTNKDGANNSRCLYPAVLALINRNKNLWPI
jgi:hypothetical protein